MLRYVLKFYKRPPNLNASKIIDRVFFEARDKELEAELLRLRVLEDPTSN